LTHPQYNQLKLFAMPNQADESLFRKLDLPSFFLAENCQRWTPVGKVNYDGVASAEISVMCGNPHHAGENDEFMWYIHVHPKPGEEPDRRYRIVTGYAPLSRYWPMVETLLYWDCSVEEEWPVDERDG